MDSLTPNIDYPMSPTGSLLRGWRPSLHWLFQHIRGSGDREYVTKEDLKSMLRGQVDSTDLDEAFDRLDRDGNGQITETEFMNGFATFLLEASSAENIEDDFDPFGGSSFRSRSSSFRRSQRRRPVQELVYEAQEGEVRKPSESFKKSLKHLSIHNRLSIQDLWKSLNESNPEAVSDFEDFVGEMASEVQSAQNALKKQKEANKLEAMELDVEMERLQNDAQAKLQEQTDILREKAETKLDHQLQEKEKELGEIRDKLLLLSKALDVCLLSALQLENELSASRHTQTEMKQKYEESVSEREELLNRLSKSEKLLQDSAETISNLKNESSKQREQQMGFEAEQEKTISQLQETYLSEITELKERLKSLQRNQEQMAFTRTPLSHHSNGVSDLGLPTTPDLLTSHHDNMGRVSPSSLLDEIVESEGTTSPVLKSTMIYTCSPLSNTHRLTTNMSPPTIFHSDSDYQSGPSATSLKELDHLDLAPPVNPEKSLLRAKSNNRKSGSRPSSMYVAYPGYPEEMDLEWPPAHWPVAHQEWLAEVASADITIQSPTHTPSPTPQSTQNISENHTPSSIANREPKPRRTKSTVNSRKDISTGPTITKKESKYFENAEKCQPLEFVESFVVQPHQTFKILVVGNPHVGKSCFLMRLCTNTFTTRYASTIGVDFFSRSIMLNEKVVSLQLWDTAGQERFQSVTRAYYRGAHGVILMYDISREDSFIAVKSWISSIQDHMDEPPAGLLLVGNKADLDEGGQREVLTETGETFAKIYGAMFSEASAKTGYNVGNACLQLVEKLIKEIGFTDVSNKGVSISDSAEKSKCPC